MLKGFMEASYIPPSKLHLAAQVLRTRPRLSTDVVFVLLLHIAVGGLRSSFACGAY